MSMKSTLRQTSDYDLFDLNELNRPLHEDKRLEESMKEHGFMPSSPIHVIPNGNGKFKVIRGHHRLHYAKRQKIPVWFVVDESNTDLFDLESGKQKWSVMDFAIARAGGGDENCQKLLWFKKKHKMPIGCAASLLGGQSAGSHNKITNVKMGTFKIGELSHANRVMEITDLCSEQGLDFVKSSHFISAVSLTLRVPEFDSNFFIQKIKLHAGILRRRATTYEYLEEIEALYNYSTKGKRIPLAFRAKEVARNRGRSFGRETS